MTPINKGHQLFLEYIFEDYSFTGTTVTSKGAIHQVFRMKSYIKLQLLDISPFLAQCFVYSKKAESGKIKADPCEVLSIKTTIQVAQQLRKKLYLFFTALIYLLFNKEHVKQIFSSYTGS